MFDNQKAVTVRGTFLQNREYMDMFYREGYTVLEMEAGPYLCAVYEDIYPRRFPVDEIVNLFINAPYDSACCTTRRTRRTAAGKAC